MQAELKLATGLGRVPCDLSWSVGRHVSCIDFTTLARKMMKETQRVVYISLQWDPK